MPKILVADDDASVCKLVKTLLESEGHSVIEATDGEQALELIGAQEPEVLVLDVRMPKLDGLGVLRKLQADGADQYRVILLTAATEEEDMMRGWGAGADDYVTKPFEPDRLVEAVDRVVNLSAKELGEHRQREIERARLLRQLDRFLE